MIKVFPQNHYQVNSFIVYDDTKECVLIDICCQTENEKKEILDFVKNNDLKVKHILITHPHIDHICGAVWATETFGLPLEMDEKGKDLLDMSVKDGYAEMMGFNVEGIEKVSFSYIRDSVIKFGDSELKIYETPGHCAGSVCFYNEKEGYVITGDVLFADSIGRTDLPTGDYDMLIANIMKYIMTLPPKTICYPGHGPKTTVEHEKDNNPFLYNR